jgi:two-component system, NtrC family, sensor kinase
MKRILIILLTINCSLFTIYCSAKLQGQARTDSLLNELPRAKEDTNKVRLLQQLAIQYAGTDPEKGMIYIKQGTELASRLGDKLGMAVENNLAGNYYFRKSDYPNALAYYFKAQALFDEIGTHDNAMYGNIGSIYRSLGEYEKALEYLFKALKASEKKGSKGSIAATTCNIGVVYTSQQNYTKALDYLFKALKLDEEGGYKEFASTVCSNIGNIYKTLKDYPLALEYHQRSLQIAEEIDYKFMIAKSIAAVGTLYLTIIDDTAANGGKVTVSPERPVGWYKPTARIPKDRATLVAEAIDHYMLALVKAKELGALNQITICYRGLSKAYKLKGDYKNAMEYGDSARVAEDSIYSNENDEKITMLENSRK